jgi:hypothetical protein
MKNNVLVFPCGSEIGLEIYKAMAYSTQFELIGGSSVDDHGMFVYKNYINEIPFVDAPGFTRKINDIIKAYKIDLIFPAHDSVVLKLAQESAEGTVECQVVTSPVKTCEKVRSKLKTYKAFNGIIPTPRVFESIYDVSQDDFPVFLKPEIGQGSKGTNIAHSLEEIAFYLSKDSSLLILEYLPAKEYTIDCFTDKDGKLRFCKGRERIRISNGISVKSSMVDDERFRLLTEKINAELTFRGAWFFQVKEDREGALVLMEIAPRIAGTMGLVRCKGVNLALLSAFDALGYDVSVFENSYDMVIDRALKTLCKHNIEYNHVYLDYDDLVLFENKINPYILAFVFQCLNKSVKVHLLTRHNQDLDKSLKNYRLTHLFDDIIWLKNGESKADYITHSDAIFIDDSFDERRKVHEAKHIPTFDAHMIESLMEKF